MAKLELSMADYLVGLFLKYSFRTVIAGVCLCLIFEVAMQVDQYQEGQAPQFHVVDLAAEILSPDDAERGTEMWVPQMIHPALETLKVWLLSIVLSLGFGIPLGETSSIDKIRNGIKFFILIVFFKYRQFDFMSF